MKVGGGRSIGSIAISLLLLASIHVLVVNSSYAEAAEQAPINTIASSTGSDEVVAASGSNRFVVWMDTSSNTDIFFGRSTDNGSIWKSLRNLSNNVGNSGFAQIAV